MATPKAAPAAHRTSTDSRRYGLSGRAIQPALRISAAHDPAEREAEQVAAQVARPATVRGAIGLQRSPLLVQRRSPGPAATGGHASPVVEARVRAAATGGSPLVPALRQSLEPRFRADFGAVRLHTDAKAAALATALGARAFTFANHIFFNSGQYQPQSPEGMELLAHELTHTIQQQAVIQRATGEAPAIHERTAPQASRLGIADALAYFADAANAIPGYRMFTILIGINPINMQAVEASAANILRAIVEFLPGGFIITRVLDSYGIFDRVGTWIEGQLKSLGITGAAIRAAINTFIDSLSWSDIFSLGSVWHRAKSIFTAPISRILAFARSLFGEILRFVREAVLRPLGALAEGTAGYGLLKAVIGVDPVTGEAVPRTAETLIGGFMALIGQQELWENIKRANAISRAWAWFQGALGGLMGLVRSIPERFVAALRGLEITDFVVLPSAFVKLARVFGGFLMEFGRWALGTVLDLLRIIVEVVAPGVMPYLRRAAGAFNTILRNPVRFVQTLVRAAMEGFRGFASRIVTHLRASLIGWLTGSMAGSSVYIPQGFNLRELLKFGLSVLGLTWINIRTKLVRATGETVVAAMETGFDIVRTLVTEGPAAAWQQIVQSLTNLQEMVIGQVMAFVQSRIVQAAITRLLSLLSPAGALIQAIIAIYNTIMFFVERLRQIAQVAASFIDAIATIAAGNIGPAAARVETTLAGLLTLVISFLARIAGLGRVSDAVKNVIDRIRAPIDRALDRVVDWIVAQARRLGRFVAQAGVPQDPNERLRLAGRAAVTAARGLGGRFTAALLAPILTGIRTRYGLRAIEPFERAGQWWARITINPGTEQPLGVSSATSGGASPGGASTTPALVWPVAVGAAIRTPESSRIERVTSIVGETITHTHHGGSPARRPHRAFMIQWNAGRIRLATSEMSADERRAELTRLHGAAVANAIMRRADLAANMAINDVRQAHHLIPIELLTKVPMLQWLVRLGWDFNQKSNGIALDAGFHGNHPQYTRYVNQRVDAWIDQHGVASPAEFQSWVDAMLLPHLRTRVAEARARYAATRQTLNEYFDSL